MFLITTLFLIVFLVLLGTTLMVSALGSMSSANSFDSREMALQAAQAGLTYIQARIENNATTYQPSAAAPPVHDFPSTAGVEVIESGWNVAGVITNPYATNQQVSMVFRAAFSPTYSGYVAPVPAATTAIPVGSWSVPGIDYVSFNNLANGNASNPDTSYQFIGGVATPLRNVPGQFCDVVVAGFLVRMDGTVLARRNVECFFQLSGVGNNNNAAAVMAPANISLNITKPVANGGFLTMGVAPGSQLNGQQQFIGLDTNASIAMTGVDAAAGATPPGYTNPGKLEVGGGGTFTYNGGPNYSGLTSNNYVAPPAVHQADVPAVRAGAANVKAGTWVNWNNAWYHYPSNNYDPTKTVSQQTWLPGVPGVSAPVLNGVGSDSPPGGEPLAASGITIPVPATQAQVNEVVLTTSDVQVQPMAGQVFPTPGVGTAAAGTVNNVTLLVAPAVAGSPVPVPINIAPTTPLNDTTALQLKFQPPPGAAQPQINSAGGITIVGSVTGNGALVTSNSATGTGNGDVTIQGQSILDPGTSSGIALYSAGSVNIIGLDPNQLPGSVVGLSGAGTTQINRDVAAMLLGFFASPPDRIQVSGVPPTLSAGDVGDLAQAILPQFQDHVAPPPITSLPAAQQAVMNDLVAAGFPYPPDDNTQHYLETIIQSLSTSTTTQTFTDDHGGTYTQTTYNFASANIAADAVSTATTSATNPQLLDQVFGGLVYSYKNFNVPQANNMLIDGCLCVYGGNPNSSSAGSDPTSGKINATASSLTFWYDPQAIGQFYSFFNNKVTLTRTLTNIF